MDPLTALGIVSNVVGLVQFGGKLLKVCRDAHAAAIGASKELDDIDSLITKLEASLRKFSRRTQARHFGVATCQMLFDDNDDDEARLLEVGERSAEIARELLKHVASCRPSDPASQRARAKSMFRYIRSHRETRDMADRLAAYQAQLDTHLLLSIKQAVVDHAAWSANFSSRFDNTEKQIIAGLQRGYRQMDDISGSVRLLHVDIPRSVREEGERTRKHISDVAARKETRDRERQYELLHESLKYEGWNRRFNSIDPPYGATGQWILRGPPSATDSSAGTSDDDNQSGGREKTSWPSLVQWLKGQDDHQVYWIAGIPAAGKSTIAKMLITNPKTLSLLKNWSAPPDRDPILIHHFFWSQATETLRKSIAGMLRSLLYQVLNAGREDWDQCFAATVLPDATINAETSRVWDIGDMITILERRFSRLDKLRLNVCLFIDALDECQDDHERLVETIRRLQLAGGPRVRILLTSRPWPVFNNAYSFSGEATVLHLHDHTASDIGRYTFEKLHNLKNFMKMAEANHEGAEELISNITNKANGVFAWVTLAVNRLRKLIVGGRTDIEMLRYETGRLPLELNAMYDEVLDRVDKELQSDCSAALLLFWLFQEAEVYDEDIQTANLFELSFAAFADRANNTDKYSRAVHTGFSGMSEECFADRALDATGGILTLKTFSPGPGGDPHVPFILHLTALEWLRQDSTLRKLSGWISGGIHAGAEAIISTLWHTWLVSDDGYGWMVYVSRLCENLHSLSPVVTSLPFEIFGRLETPISFARILWEDFLRWSGSFMMSLAIHGQGQEEFESRYITLTSAIIVHGRARYLPHIIQAATHEELLMAAIGSTTDFPEVRDLGCLIGAGVGPDELVPELGLSPWTNLLLTMNREFGGGVIYDEWQRGIVLLQHKGAPAVADTRLHSVKSDETASAPLANEYLTPRLLAMLKQYGLYDGPICSEHEWAARMVANGYEVPWLDHDLACATAQHWLENELLYQEFLTALPPITADESEQITALRSFYEVCTERAVKKLRAEEIGMGTAASETTEAEEYSGDNNEGTETQVASETGRYQSVS